MKITKYIHSCLLVENDGKIILLDPGMYSESAVNVDAMTHLDAIGITHDHMDHVYVPLLKKLLTKFPNTPVYGPTTVKTLLEKEGISVETKGNEYLTMELVPHEKVWMGPVAENVMITLFNRLSHPGDSLSFTHSADILALPITAPWGSPTWAFEKAMEIQPKIIIPIHDFQWKDEVRMGMYQRLEQDFAKEGIQFLKAETGEVFEV